MHDLDRGERLEVQRRCRVPDGGQHRGVVLEGKPRMETAHDVELGGPRLGGLDGRIADLVHAHLVGAVLVSLAVERAEGAAQGAHVRVVHVSVDVVVGGPAVHPSPHQVRQAAHPVDVGGLVEDEPVLQRKPPTVHHLGRDRLEGGVVEADRWDGGGFGGSHGGHRRGFVRRIGGDSPSVLGPAGGVVHDHLAPPTRVPGRCAPVRPRTSRCQPHARPTLRRAGGSRMDGRRRPPDDR